MAILGSAVATFALVLPSWIFDNSYQQDAVQIYEHHSRTSIFIGLRPAIVGLVGAAALLLMNREKLLISCIRWHFYIILSPALPLPPSSGVKFRRHQPHPHDMLLCFCRIAVAVLQRIISPKLNEHSIYLRRNEKTIIFCCSCNCCHRICLNSHQLQVCPIAE